MDFSKLKQMPEIRSVMTPFPYSVEIEDPLSHAQQMMAEHRIRHLPVMEDGRLVGVVADRDVRLLVDPRLGRPADGVKVGEVCVREAYVVGVQERLDTVLLHMAQAHIGSALVVKGGRLAGIFTVTDACRAFGELLRSLFPAAGGDDAA